MTLRKGLQHSLNIVSARIIQELVTPQEVVAMAKRFQISAFILETLAASYHLSAVETAAKLGVELKEVEDWNCCGATPYSHIDEFLAQCLSARNLAIAEKAHLDVVAPCSGCYKNLYHANAHLKSDPDLAEHINFALEEDNLHYDGTITVHHLMQMLVNEVGIDAIKEQVTKPLKTRSLRFLHQHIMAKSCGPG